VKIRGKIVGGTVGKKWTFIGEWSGFKKVDWGNI
jgi:hypothetical protein